MKTQRDRTTLTALAPFLWLCLFFLFPFLLVAKLSLSDTALAIPPYTPRIDWSAGIAGLKAFFAGLDFATYARLTTDRSTGTTRSGSPSPGMRAWS